MSGRDDVRRLGQSRPRRLGADHPARPRRRHQLRRHRRRLLARASPRRSSGKALAERPPRQCRAGDEGRTARWATTPTRRATRGAGSSQEVENSLRRLGTDWIDLYQIHRPDPATDIDETLGALTDLVRAGKIRYFGSSTFPAHRDRRGAVGRPSAAGVSGSCASSRRTRSWCAASRPTCCRRARSTAWASSRGARWPAAGCRAVTARARTLPTRHRAQRAPGALRPRRCPANQRKLEAAEELGAARRGGRASAGRAGGRLRARAPGGHLRDHRAAHDGAAGDPARRGRRRA